MLAPLSNNTLLHAQQTEHRQRLSQLDAVAALGAQQIEELSQLCALSDYVARITEQYPATIGALNEYAKTLLSAESEQALQQAIRVSIRAKMDTCSDEAAVMSALRKMRHEWLSAITCCDLIHQQPIQDSLTQVSVLAEELISAAYHWQYQQLEARYGAPMGPHGKQPLCILAMGKLGGRELNFSSDIDLIFAYPEKGETQGGRKSLENHQFFTKLGQKLIQLLDNATADGFVYRVDMRLRPFGDSGPLVANFSALEDYYQEQGRDWERYAMLKARVINTNDTYAQELQALLRPFVYRRYVDFTALDSLRNMKQLIEKEVRRKQLKDNIKLGAGGIREVEFFVQSMQIIHAGRHQQLQTPSLRIALRELVNCELLDADEAQAMLTNYDALRKAEHCIQQFNDQQTQQLPSNDLDQARLTYLLGFRDWPQCHAAIERNQNQIHHYFSLLIETPEEAEDRSEPLVVLTEDLWALELLESDWQSLLTPYCDADDIATLWHDTTAVKQRLLKIPMGQRGANSLNRLMPWFLHDVMRHAKHPNLASLAPVIISIAGRTAYLDLLLENQQARYQLINLTTQSEWISEQIARFPLLLDELLDPAYLANQTTDIQVVKQQMQSQLQQSLLRVDPDDLEAMMNTWRQFKLSQQLIVAAADVCQTIPTNAVSDHLTVLAETLLDSVIRSAWRDMSKRYGEPEGCDIENSGLVVIGYGKLGGLELGYGSDLDVVFLHNAERQQQTNGKKPVSAAQFYVKLVQRVMHLMSTNTQIGNVYEIDLRLRPNGNSGMLCSHIEGYLEYLRDQAWTWEHQALVRTRPVWGSATLQSRVSAIKRLVLTSPKHDPQLRTDVSEMREKMRTHLLKETDTHVDLKQTNGGITDIEFMTQYWVLKYACQCPELSEWPDNLRILDALAAHQFISIESAEILKQSYLDMRQLLHTSSLHNLKLVKNDERVQRIRATVSELYNAVLKTDEE